MRTLIVCLLIIFSTASALAKEPGSWIEEREWERQLQEMRLQILAMQSQIKVMRLEIDDLRREMEKEKKRLR